MCLRHPPRHPQAPVGLLLLLILLSGWGVGCSGPGQGDGATFDVHVAGSEWRGEVPVAKYWKNGSGIDLTDGIHPARALGIALSGEQVFIAGGQFDGQLDRAVYWRNGTPVTLPDRGSGAFAVGIAVSGSDVFVVGWSGDPAKYGIPEATLWKNGTPTVLTDGTGWAQANAVAVSGTDVHVVGWEYQANQVDPTHIFFTSHAVHWKNGVKTTLTAPASGGGATGIALSGPDVYICGNEFLDRYGVAKVWKNGVPTVLTDGSRGANALGVVPFRGTVHAGGVENDGTGAPAARCWRGAAPVSLSGQQVPTLARGLAVAPGGEALVVGTAFGPGAAVATVWVDGQRKDLTQGLLDAEANAIALGLRPLW